MKLKFPEYFGANWNALDECLADLGWLDRIGYLSVIESGDSVLCGEETDIQNASPNSASRPPSSPNPPRQSPPTATASGKGPSKAQQAFARGLAALEQWVEREGTDRPVPRGAVIEIVVDGASEPVPVRLGAWISNTESRRDRLNADQLAVLAKLGMDWAASPPAISVAARPALKLAPPTGPTQRSHHDECDKASYEGGTCTCDLIEEYGPPSERDDY